MPHALLFSLSSFMKMWETILPLPLADPLINEFATVYQKCTYGGCGTRDIFLTPAPPDVAETLSGAMEHLNAINALPFPKKNTVALIKERTGIYASLFSNYRDIPEQDMERYFYDFVYGIDRMLEAGHGDSSLAVLSRAAMHYADYCKDKTRENNSLAEKAARNRGYIPAQREVEAYTRRSVSCGGRALALISRLDVPVPAPVRLFAGTEASVEDAFSIDRRVLRAVSADNLSAVVHVDKRFDILKKTILEMCRSFVRLGSYDKAKRCEDLAESLPLGYRDRRKKSIVDFEDGNWRDILNAPQGENPS